MRLIILLVVALTAVVAVNRLPSQSSPAAIAIVPPTAAVRLVSLGRASAAADALWLRVVQMCGEEAYAQAGYPELEKWLAAISDLSPDFALVYTYGAVLLVTDPSRAEAVDELLERGEEHLPPGWHMPMLRGFVSYFGLGDYARAAEHYRRSGAQPDAPPYLAAFGERLAREGSSCAALRDRLGELVQTGESELVTHEARNILESCFKRRIKQAAASFRLKEGRGASSIAELRETNWLTEEPLAPRGLRWTLDENGEPAMVPVQK